MQTYSYIVQKSEKMKFFTHLSPIFDSINNVQKNYNWLLTDLECNYYPYPLEYNKDISLSGQELTKIANLIDSPQFVWGVYNGPVLWTGS